MFCGKMIERKKCRIISNEIEFWRFQFYVLNLSNYLKIAVEIIFHKVAKIRKREYNMLHKRNNTGGTLDGTD